ncbi:MAG: 2-oxoglutarate oxidoreductase [Deltaproteobacteria bacterium]|nr:2-oxoglutarate oxidoreductase [Deltaproteobacteria bacterium]
MYGLKMDWELESRPRLFCIEDYEGATPRWCPGCGDHAVLNSLLRLARDERLVPEKTVVVSGIGCSSRFPHYLKTYGFHSLHGRPLPVASGVRSRRPDLNIFVVTGDGDNCAIGTAHWIHAIRYNMKMVVMLLDNNIYGLTKAQTSPTTRKGDTSNTHPGGAVLDALDPLAVTLSITNASFVAQSVDWNPIHVYATLKAAHQHPGLAFVRILQRCPHYTDSVFEPLQRDPRLLRLLTHPDGINLPDAAARMFPNGAEHDPSDLKAAFALATDKITPIGLLYRNLGADRYDMSSAEGVEMSSKERLKGLENELARFQI